MRKLDLTGQRFGRLVAKERRDDGKWVCVCDCGKETVVFRGALRSGHTRSCGCLAAEVMKDIKGGRTRRKSKLNGARRLTFRGVEKTLSAWAIELNLSESTIRARLSRDWSVRRALATPSRHVDWSLLASWRLKELAEITLERVTDEPLRRELIRLTSALAERASATKGR